MSEKEYPCDYCGSMRDEDEQTHDGFVFCSDHDCEENFRKENNPNN